MATAGAVVVAEVEHIVQAGALNPEHVHTPGIFVDMLFEGSGYVKPIEKLTVRKREALKA